MKKIISILICFHFVLAINAQQKKLILDNESLFTHEEMNHIDSLLQAYNQHSGNFVVVCSDSLDVTTSSYLDNIISKYTFSYLPTHYSLFLLLSRKNSKLFLTSNDQINGNPDPFPIFKKIMDAGIPALEEKKLEVAVIIICKKAMDYLDSLPRLTD